MMEGLLGFSEVGVAAKDKSVLMTNLRKEVKITVKNA